MHHRKELDEPSILKPWAAIQAQADDKLLQPSRMKRGEARLNLAASHVAFISHLSGSDIAEFYADFRLQGL